MNIAEKHELRGSFLRHYRQIYWQEHKDQGGKVKCCAEEVSKGQVGVSCLVYLEVTKLH